MSPDRCAEVEALVPELALGLLTGEERARALAHVETCSACRSELEGLSATADQLLAAVPPAEPALGFEERVLARSSSHRADAAGRGPGLSAGRSRAVLLAVAAAVVLLVAGLVVATVRQPGGDTREAAMVSTKGVVVGKATLTKRPAGVLVAVPGWVPAEDRPYGLRVHLTTGRAVTLGSVQLEDGYGGYGLGSIDPAKVEEIELLRSTGEAICAARF